MVAIFPGLLDLMRHQNLDLTKDEITEAKSDKEQSVHHQNITHLEKLYSSNFPSSSKASTQESVAISQRP